jgi:urease accessory protein
MSLATLLVLADGRLPSGGHAHSGGLEAAVATGRVRDVAGLEGFLHGRLATSGSVAAAFAASACARATPPALAVPRSRPFPAGAAPPFSAPPTHLTAGDAPSVSIRPTDVGAALAELDAGLDARTPSPALRSASRAQGRALLRAGRAMWALPPIGREPHHPVALGALAAAAGLGPAEAAVAAAHGTITGPAGAAVRLLGLDPYAVHALLAALAPACDALAADAAIRVDDPVDDLPAAGAPLLDIGAEQHASWEVRLFAS